MNHCPSLSVVKNQIPEGLTKCKQRAKTIEEDWKWQRGITSCSLSGNNWRKRRLSVRKWESQKARKLGHARRRNQVLCHHRWLFASDHDDEVVPMHGMYGTFDAELEAQHTMKKAELTAFLSLLR